MIIITEIKIEMINTLISFFTFFSDILGYLYVLLKIFRLLCYTKITFDQLPLFNPYMWPLSSIRVLTQPYFKFWAKLLPPLKIGKGSYDISVILGLEFLSTILYMFSTLRLTILTDLEKYFNYLNSL